VQGETSGNDIGSLESMGKPKEKRLEATPKKGDASRGPELRGGKISRVAAVV